MTGDSMATDRAELRRSLQEWDQEVGLELWRVLGSFDVPGASYAMNAWFQSRPAYGVSVPNLWKSCLVQGASGIPVYCDCRAAFALPYASDAPPSTRDAPLGSDPMTPGLPRYAMDRHGGGINMLFMDWSVRKVGIRELWTLKWTREFDRAGPWTKAGGVQPENWPQWMRRFRDY